MVDDRIRKIDGTDITLEIQEIMIRYLKNVFKNLRNLHLDDLTPNPLLMKLVGTAAELNSAHQLVEYMLNARIERSTSTGFGMTIQKIATAFCEKTGVGGADISIVKENDFGVPVRWYIQMKSGPNTVNKDICIQISSDLQSAVRRAPGSAGLLGITYGKADRVSGITQQYLSFDFEAGRDFWEFISNDPECYRKLWYLTISIAENFEDRGGLTLKELIELKREELTAEFLSKYGESGNQMWNNFLEENM
ncbi:PmeII family type II restriction endonuclease [Neobacillus sp. DY30]|uniref:PmeII family type II restriction endonuclease n=1 Tax=Neobacillus sp. DY30 TaxID=3047871 RepID=UPI0024BF2590|nr:PmeII family type II restriction endonuclease [Neobacillus sp. DY30]WHX97951.1 PmeII family type II restriction endonuclease [Neobacillus sp. DY30]